MRSAAALGVALFEALLALALCVVPAAALLGISFSDVVSDDTLACVKAAGYEFGVVRAWHSYGAFDNSSIDALRAMAHAGMAPADVQMNPCPTDDAADQMTALIDRLTEADVVYDTIWVHVESGNTDGCAWPIEHTRNCKYVAQLLHTAQSLERTVGVVASAFAWGSVVGESCQVGAPDALHALLTYEHFNRQPNFDDFKTFGGWTEPTAKQFAATFLPCGDRGMNVLENFRNATASDVARVPRVATA